MGLHAEIDPPGQTVTIDAPGAVLRGTLIAPPGGTPALAVLINAATGVPAAWYRPFAQWLARERSAAVLIWDYRDFGASGTVYHSRATMTDWGVTDPVAAREWMERRFPGLPLWVIGHSLGGLALAFQPGIERIARAITVAAGPGHVSEHPWPFRWQARLLWSLAGPLSVQMLGYLPGRRLGLGSDLPAPVFAQWRRWCTDRRSLPADPDLPPRPVPGLVCPVTLVAMADDVMIPPHAVWRLGEWMPQASVTRLLIDPAAEGCGPVGHIALFSPRHAGLWPRLIG